MHSNKERPKLFHAAEYAENAAGQVRVLSWETSSSDPHKNAHKNSYEQPKARTTGNAWKLKYCTEVAM